MKKNLLALTFLLAPALSFAAAAPDKFRDPVVVPAIGFTAKLVDGTVVMNWKRYKRDDFFAYEVIKSEKDVDPSFAPKKSLIAMHGVGDIDYKDGKLTAGTFTYRVVILTIFGDVWLSPVVTLTVAESDLKRPVPTVADFE